MEYTKAFMRVRQFRIFLILSIILSLFCIGCLVASVIMTNEAYRDFTQLSVATNIETRAASYQRAIKMCPERPEAYLLILEAYGEDGALSKKESEAFLSIYNTHHHRLKKDISYGLIHANAGMLYINAYDDVPAVKLRKALPFFEAAKDTLTPGSEEYIVSSCYASIGQYYRDFIWTAGSKEVSAEQMTTLIGEIQTTYAALSASTAPDAVYNYLGFSEAVCNLFYDQRDILAVTVPKEAVLDILNMFYSTLPDENTLQSEPSREIVRTFHQNRELYFDMIDRAYERGGAA